MEFLKIAARFNKSSSSKQPPSSESSQSEHIPSTSSSTTHSHYAQAQAQDAPLTSNNHNDSNNGNDEDYEEEDDDDDFITNEVKRRLKELRKSSFMVLIPEEEPTPDDDHDHHHHHHGDHDNNDDDDEDDRSLPADAAFPFGLDALDAWLCGFDALYTKYSERMLFFDRSIAHLLSLPLPLSPNAASRRSPRSPSALASTLRSLSFKRGSSRDNADDLQPQSTPDPYHTLETAYVAQLSLSWEALHTQYAHLNLKISSSQPDPCISYTRAAQAFQQFQVLLQRFIESEPFQPGSRVHIYTRSRSHLSKLLQVPNYQALDKGNQPRDDDAESDLHVAATDLIKVLEESILTFRLFLKKDKTKSGAVLGVQSTAGSSLHQVQASLDKKETKVKELFKKKKGWKSKAWPGSVEEVELVFALIDIKVVARVLRMAQLSKEQLLWCEEKMSKIDLSSENKLRRDSSPILFPC